MSPDLEAVLRSRYPRLLRREGLESSTSDFRLHCDDGWFPLIADHFAALQRLHDEGRTDQPIASEVKQKFGQLRVSLANPSAESIALAEALRLKSANTCELCGSPGLLRWYAGVKTLCDDHAPFGTPVVYPQPTWQTRDVSESPHGV